MPNPGGGPSKGNKRPRRISETERAEIIAALRDEPNISKVARAFKRAKGTISKIAADNRISTERSQTKSATEAQRADNAERLERIKSRLLIEAEKGLDELHAEVETIHWHQDVMHRDTLDSPSVKDKRDISWRIGSMVRNYLEIEHRETSDGIADALTIWRDELKAEKERRGL